MADPLSTPPDTATQQPAAPAAPANDGQPSGNFDPMRTGQADADDAFERSIMENPAQKRAEEQRAQRERQQQGDDAADANKGGDQSSPATDAGKGEETPPTDAELEAAVSRSNLPKHGKDNWRKMREGMSERDKRIAELDAKVKEYDEFKKKAGPIPDDLKAEIARATKERDDYAARLREQDIKADPAFHAKYNAPMESNRKSIADILTAVGKRDGATDAQIKDALAEYAAKGYSIDSIATEIRNLESSGHYGEASRLRMLAERNLALAQDREQELTSWQQSYTARSAERAQRQQNEAAEALQIATDSMRTAWDSDTAALAEKFPFLKEPPKPLPTDSPTETAIKKVAHEAWSESMADAQKQIDELNGELGLPDAKKRASAQGRIYARAKLSVVLQRLIENQYSKSDAALKKELAEAKAQLAALNKTGDLSRAHAGDMGGSAAVTVKPTGNAGADFENAFEKSMRAQGVDTRR